MNYVLPPAQPRTPPGVSTGGQYAATPREESPVSLQLPAREYNADGTFEFPPIARDAEQLVDFWLRVPVPDQVLHQLRAEYHEAQLQWRVDRLAELEVEEGDPEPEKMRHARVTPEWDAWFERRNQREVELLAEHPGGISQVMTRPLARITMMHRQAQTLEDVKPGITQEIRALPVDMSVMGTHTVGSLLDLYPTLDLPERTWTDQRVEYSAVAADKLDELVDFLREQRGDPTA